MKKITLFLLLSMTLFSGVYADDISDVRVRVTNIQAPLSGNLPSVTGDSKGYVGEILSKIFSTTGKIKGEFINSFDSIWNKNLNNVVKWNGTSFITGNIYDTGGLVGIGTSSPDVKLEVNGNIKSLGRTIFLGDTQRLNGDNNTALGFISNNASNSQISLYDSNGNKAGSFYGSTTGSGIIGILDSNSKFSYQAITDYATIFRIGNSEKMRILSNGSVGIGTSNPTEKLDVNGKIVMRNQTEDTDAANIVATKGYVDTHMMYSFGGGFSTTKGACSLADAFNGCTSVDVCSVVNPLTNDCTCGNGFTAIKLGNEYSYTTHTSGSGDDRVTTQTSGIVGSSYYCLLTSLLNSEPGWYQTNSATSCSERCSMQGLVSKKDPVYSGECLSGEHRLSNIESQHYKISYIYGTWGSGDASNTSILGEYCYAGKKDGDTTDLTVACYCGN